MSKTRWQVEIMSRPKEGKGKWAYASVLSFDNLEAAKVQYMEPVPHPRADKVYWKRILECDPSKTKGEVRGYITPEEFKGVDLRSRCTFPTR